MTRTILLFGDSNTHGTMPMRSLSDRGRFGPDIRWGGFLKADLGADATVIEEGHPGRTTVHPDPIEGTHKSGIASLPVALETHRPIDLVILKLGTNDLKARFSVTADDIARSVDRLCGEIQISDAAPDGRAPQILLICPPPAREAGCLAGFFQGAAEKSRALAPLLAEVARERGIAYLDAGAHIDVSPLDGIHYEADAHATLGRTVAAQVAAMLD